MERVKLVYTLNGTQCEEELSCRVFSASGIIEEMECKVEFQTGSECVISILFDRWTSDDVLLYSFDCKSGVMSGFATQIKTKQYVYGIWLDYSTVEFTDPDELYETNECDEQLAVEHFIETMDLTPNEMETFVVRLISEQ